MIDLLTAPYAALLLRWSLGVMFIAHAFLKWRVFTLPVVAANFRSLGLPGWLAHVVTIVELIGGTITTVHGKNGWPLSNAGGGWEFPAFWAATLVVQFLVGDGAWAWMPSPSVSSLIAALR